MRKLAIVIPLLMSACAYNEPRGGAAMPLIGASGQTIGTVRAWQTAGGVSFRIDARGLPHGVHGIHVHPIGRCDPPDFSTAGTHWNPSGREHGMNNPKGPHDGDMPNVTVAANGVLQETVVLPKATMGQLLDADGSSIMIHAGPDDYVSQPAGNSGAKIACAVIRPSAELR
ncbi:superoxide dismutase family protein [Sphingomonas flavescens]|jgi:Cu-Zn family superoxide dismutase|uniref:superoxide dismutase family protein n=1 Tax=Sphingomonas flavescens TaxID=3132797 RepID=UPI002803CCD6|nr:superoxide dismutase family protein [Sphingomonas limnosediminicola]